MLMPNSDLAGDSPTDTAAAFAGQVKRYLRAFQRLLKATPNGVTYREGVSGSAFHAAVLRNNEIPPLKKEQPAIGAHVSPGDTVAGLWCNDRHPYRNRDVAHQLPAVNGKG
jgi:hypothetical protein